MQRFSLSPMKCGLKKKEKEEKDLSNAMSGKLSESIVRMPCQKAFQSMI